MFIEKLQKDNANLIDAACRLHQEGKLLPDSYVVDLEQFRKNASFMKKAADDKGIRLFFMLKQLGRNPVLAKELVEMGYEGAVVVDYKEAQVMMRHRIPIGNVGHLVQVPQVMLRDMVDYGPEYITVFSEEKAKAVSQAAVSLGKVQKLMIRVCDDSDMMYSGQTAGIPLKDLPRFLEHTMGYPRDKGCRGNFFSMLSIPGRFGGYCSHCQSPDSDARSGYFGKAWNKG